MPQLREIMLFLPVLPPPLSACFVNIGRSRKDSERYKQWKQAADAFLVRSVQKLLGVPNRPTFNGEVSVSITLERPHHHAGDLDNRNKALLDTLARNFVLGDDSQVIDLRIRWATEKMNWPVRIFVSKLADAIQAEAA